VPQNFEHRTIVIPAEGGTPLHVFVNDPRTDAFRSAFTPDGKAFAYVATQDGVSNLWVQPLDGGPAKPMTFFKSDRIDDFAFSHDGKKLALLRGRTNRDVVLIRDTGQ
jgi:Tol biopolymer transport system component